MLDLIALTIIISASGALSPGPLTVATVAVSLKRNWKVGVLAALGHMTVEIPYIIILILIYEQIKIFLQNFIVKVLFLTFILIFILMFAFFIIRESLSKVKIEMKIEKIYHPFLIGVIFSILNPYFLLWWVTVGFVLIKIIIESGNLLLFFIVMYIAHVWLDYAWLTGLASVASLSTNFLGSKGHRIIMFCLGIFLIYLAIGIVLGEFFKIKILF
jgi:threonine/homoserine/homoserine lactone efflux protein